MKVNILSLVLIIGQIEDYSCNLFIKRTNGVTQISLE